MKFKKRRCTMKMSLNKYSRICIKNVPLHSGIQGYWLTILKSWQRDTSEVKSCFVLFFLSFYVISNFRLTTFLSLWFCVNIWKHLEKNVPVPKMSCTMICTLAVVFVLIWHWDVLIRLIMWNRVWGSCWGEQCLCWNELSLTLVPERVIETR